MATFCSQCGEELPRDGVQFCNNCGARQATRLASSLSSTGTDNNSLSGVMPPANVQSQSLIEGASPPLPSRMQAVSDIEELPMWMHNLQRDPRNEQAIKDKKQPVSQEQEVKSQDVLVRNEQQEHLVQQQPEPAIHTTVMERPAQSHASSEQMDFPAVPSTPQSFSPVLHVKVWSEANISQPGLKEDVVRQEDIKPVSLESKAPMQASVQEGHAVEDLPTHLMEAIAQPAQTNLSIDDIPTNPLHAFPGERLQSNPGQNAQSQPEQVPSDVADVSDVNTVYLKAQQQSHTPPPPSALSKSDHSAAPTHTPALTTRGRKRLPLVIGSATVLLLLALALGSWIIMLQPFRVSPVTDTQQSFIDAKLGVSLRYPNGWKTPQVDYGKQIITLQDGSDTAQINMYIASASADSPESYLQKQAARLGINNPKPGTPSSFADSSWQSIQGDAQVRGAEYTYGLFTTLRNKHFYTLTQLAPRTTYSDEEKLVFAPTRLSLHFL